MLKVFCQGEIGALAFLCMCSALISACDDEVDEVEEPPGQLVAQTDYIDVYSTEDAQICAGTLRAWDRHVVDVAQGLGYSGEIERISVALVSNPSEYCEGPMAVSGCAKPMLALGVPRSILHEMAHVVQIQIDGYVNPGLGEGFAEYWSGFGGKLSKVNISDNIAADLAWSVDYSSMRHFIGWMYSTYGVEAVAQVFEDSDPEGSSAERFAQLREALGASWRSIQFDFWSDAPLYDPGQVECDEIAGTVDLTEPLVLEVPLACERPDTYGPMPVRANQGKKLGGIRVIEVAEAGSYVAQVDQGTLALLPCESVDSPLSALRWGRLDNTRRIGFESSSREVFDLDEGRYRVWVLAEDYEPVTISFALYGNRPTSRVALLE